MSYRLGIHILVGILLCSGFAYAQTDRSHKKIIEYGWDVPTPDFLRAHIQEMEKRPFDGVILLLRTARDIFRHNPYDAKLVDQDTDNLRAIAFSKFTDNFVLMLATADKGWDWFSDSDWEAAEQNIRLITRTARAGRCAGIVFDPEPYGLNPWNYQLLPGAKEKSFQQYYAQVRKRGAQYIKALQQEWPGLKVLTFFQLSHFPSLLDISDPAEQLRVLPHQFYALLPAFLNGMLDALESNTTIIDGNENSYYYAAKKSFNQTSHMIHTKALSLVDSKNRSRYSSQVQVGQALYTDWVFAKREPQDLFVSSYLTPAERAKWFEHNVYYALDTSNEYVWCYSEKINWWVGSLPPGSEDAIRSARQKYEQGLPLGFNIEEMIQVAEKRMQEKTQSNLTRRTAMITKLKQADKPPIIDGKLDDPIWSKLKPLGYFLPILANSSKKLVANTLVWATYDDRFLYVAFRCEDPHIDRLTIIGEKPNDRLWLGDAVMFGISKEDTSPDPYYRFTVNPKGVQLSERVTGGQANLLSNLDWKSVASVGNKEWTVEMAIPWSAINGLPSPGSTRRANVGRLKKLQVSTSSQVSSWSQVVRDMVDAGQLGRWIFSD